MAELKFAIFMVGISTVFFLPNGWPTLVCTGLSLAIGCIIASRNGMMLARRNLRKLVRMLPFVGFVVLCNGLFANWLEAAWVGDKLVTVCILTLTYCATTTTTEVTRVLAGILRPLRRLGVEIEDVYLLVAISFRLIPILRRTFSETRTACRAKGAKWDLKTARIVLERTSWQMLARVEQIEMALIAKGS